MPELATEKLANTAPSPWLVYIVECADRSLYAGITTDIQRRLKEHNGAGSRSAKYTRSRAPVTLVFYQCAPNRSSASKLEAQIKKLTKQDKLRLIEQFRLSTSE